MRTLSLTWRRAFNASSTGELPVFLVTVEHDALDEPKRFSSDPTSVLSDDPLQWGTTSRGETYDYLPMEAVLPDDADDTPPAVRLVLDNVSRELVPLIRSVSTPAKVTIEVVLASAPDDVEDVYPQFDLVKADYDEGRITLDLTFDGMAAEPYPSATMTPSGFPGLF